MPRFAIMGAGAIGTWLGAALSEVGEDVTLLGRGPHSAAMQSGGVLLRDADGGRRIPVVAAGDPADVGAVDVVLLCVKAHDLPVAAARMAPLLGPATTVVALQNGIPWWWFHPGAERRVEAVDPGGAVSTALPPARVLGSVVYLGASVPEPGVLTVRPEAGLVLGEPDGSASSRLEHVATALEGAGFPVRRTADIRAEIWTKLMGNASFNLLSVLTRAGLGGMANDPGVRPVVARLMGEIVEVAAAHGAPVTLSIDERIALTGRLGDHRTSTLQDLDAGKRLELDALGAAVLELADAAGVEAPTLRTVFALADLQARELGLR